MEAHKQRFYVVDLVNDQARTIGSEREAKKDRNALKTLRARNQKETKGALSLN
jgi:hypothetical protein